MSNGMMSFFPKNVVISSTIANVIIVEVEFFGFDIYIAGQNVVEDDVFDKAALVVFLVVQVLDVGECYREKRRVFSALLSSPSTNTI